MLYEYQKVWRAIWTDGREAAHGSRIEMVRDIPSALEDDYTLLSIRWVGRKELGSTMLATRTAATCACRKFITVDRDVLELTIKIDDPKAYTEAWLALNKLILRRQPASSIFAK